MRSSSIVVARRAYAAGNWCLNGGCPCTSWIKWRRAVATDGRLTVKVTWQERVSGCRLVRDAGPQQQQIAGDHRELVRRLPEQRLVLMRDRRLADRHARGIEQFPALLPFELEDRGVVAVGVEGEPSVPAAGHEHAAADASGLLLLKGSGQPSALLEVKIEVSDDNRPACCELLFKTRTGDDLPQPLRIHYTLLRVHLARNALAGVSDCDVLRGEGWAESCLHGQSQVLRPQWADIVPDNGLIRYKQAAERVL